MGDIPAFASLRQLIAQARVIKVMCACGHQAVMHPEGLRRHVGDRYLRQIRFRCTFCGDTHPQFRVGTYEPPGKRPEKMLR